MCFQASLQELEQRRPLLERQVTAAQNLKNKTSNQDTRNAITERSTSLSHTHTHILYFKKCVCFLKDTNLFRTHSSTQTWKTTAHLSLHERWNQAQNNNRLMNLTRTSPLSAYYFHMSHPDVCSTATLGLLKRKLGAAKSAYPTCNTRLSIEEDLLRL